MTRHRRSTTAAALLSALIAASPASAAFINYDLTGTWTGTTKCNDFATGVKQKSAFAPEMKISQLGVNIGVQLTLPTGPTLFYGGLINADVKKPEQKGEAILIRCGTDTVLNTGLGDEMVRMAASTKPGKVKASFKGFSFYSTGTDINPLHGTCKWKFTRIDNVDPGLVTSCAQNGLQAGGAK